MVLTIAYILTTVHFGQNHKSHFEAHGEGEGGTKLVKGMRVTNELGERLLSLYFILAANYPHFLKDISSSFNTLCS